MGLFDIFKKKSSPVDRETLVPHITKSVIDLFVTDMSRAVTANLTKINVSDFNRNFFIADELSYRSNDKYFGWIGIQDCTDDDCDTVFHTISMYLIAASSVTEKYKTLFHFNYKFSTDFHEVYKENTAELENYTFGNVVIPSSDDDLEKCLRIIRNYAGLYNYQHPPSYLMFASMI